MDPVAFPNESQAYRTARNELLNAEAQLRAQIERVAEQRRLLPPGGELKEDYVFDELVDGRVREVKFSELFAPGQNDLFVYNFMYSDSMQAPCPMCAAMLDSLEGQANHLNQRVSTAVVARRGIADLCALAAERGWKNLRMLSSKSNSYNRDYYGEMDGGQTPFANVFRRNDNAIRHFWGTELFFHAAESGQHMRHIDMIWPLWNVLDMTASGRGTDWLPALSY